MVDNISIVIPFYQGHDTIERLIKSISTAVPVYIIDDMSDPPLQRAEYMGENVKIIRRKEKGYFTGAVNTGVWSCRTDVLVLNQDTWFDNGEWYSLLLDKRRQYAMIGERISGEHPAFGSFGYIHGTFMFLRRDALDIVGPFNSDYYPLWGSTAEWQWRAARKGYKILPLVTIPGFHHERSHGDAYGSSIQKLLMDQPDKKKWFIQTPPLLSVIVPCYNYGRYLEDCINSLIGGPSSLGNMPGQSLQSFEVIIVDDASTDETPEVMEKVIDITKGIRGWRREQNGGTARTLNYGIERAVGRYITFLSADDMREPDSLQQLVRACQLNEHMFSYDDITLFYRNKRIKEWEMQDYDFESTLYKNQVHAGIVFPKKAWEDVGGYPEIMDNGREDWAFNVALGIKGWCGVHVKQFGYLYRREHQNRSLTNTSPEHHKKFLNKIAGLFPEVYRGERPMACCGKGRTQPSRTSARSSQQLSAKRSLTTNGTSGGFMAPEAGSAGMVLMVYEGKAMTSVWDGGITNTRYRFGVDGHTRGWVDKRDAGERGHTGFLNIKDSKGNYVFSLDDTAPQPNLTAEPVVDSVVISPEPAGVSMQAGTAEAVQQEAKVTVSELTVDYPNPTDYTATEIQALSLSKEQWELVYKAELAGKNRKGVITFIEEKLASE